MFAIDIVQLEHLAPVQGALLLRQVDVLIEQLHRLHARIRLERGLIDPLREEERACLLERLGRIGQASRGVEGSVRFLVVVHPVAIRGRENAGTPFATNKQE
uniref:Uncharacterized protein n=1 Tax=Anopheles atroparvus TaxID=41427 RepID=A0A182ILK3_ANOAO